LRYFKYLLDIKYGKQGVIMKEIGLKVRKVDLVDFNGLMNQFMRVNG